MRPILTAILLCAMFTASSAQTPSDRARVAELLRQAAAATAPQIVSGKVVIATQPKAPPPVVLQVFVEEFQKKGIAVYADNDSADRVTIDCREINSSPVSLQNSSYLRKISVNLGVLAHSRAVRDPYWSKSFQLSVIDTVAAEPEEIDFMETESSSIWDSVLIPAVVSAATIIIAVLLFTVRGSS